ncbi:hypothetical protein BXZ70DRAFT_1009247 [Cristinia sonorae]|uniref:Uncharacterized protein n=1 Tax=Cristinia sonorae TaxID=1940300 RepID=A0A8K0XPE3_9AGAR|nr:hypothetical protein BXZ70DRAFT_1009247 [Cristinia sonorae]
MAQESTSASLLTQSESTRMRSEDFKNPNFIIVASAMTSFRGDVLAFDGKLRYPVPMTPVSDNKGGYKCPVCSSSFRALPHSLRAHLQRECKGLKKEGQCPDGSCKERVDDLWLHHQLVHVPTSRVEYRGCGGIYQLRNDEDGQFWCKGCDFRTPFPGSLMFHAPGCQVRREEAGSSESSESTNGQVSIGEPTSNGPPSPEPDSRSDNGPGPSPASPSAPTKAEFVSAPILSVKRKATGDHGSPPAKRLATSSGDASALQSGNPSVALGNRNCSLQAGFPGKRVHSFIYDLPHLSHEARFAIFNCFGRLGIRMLPDLEASYSNPDQTRELLLSDGLSFTNWVIIRHHLVLFKNLSDTDLQALDADSKLLPFLEDNSLQSRGNLLRGMGLRHKDIEHLARLRLEWASVTRYLVSQGFTFVDCLSFKRGLIALAKTQDGSPEAEDSPALTAFVADLQPEGKMLSKVMALANIGLESVEDLDMWCALEEEKMDEVLNMLSMEGLNWLECKAVRRGLTKRAEGLKERE